MKKYLLIGLFLLGLFIYPIKAISGNTPEELYESLQKRLASDRKSTRLNSSH